MFVQVRLVSGRSKVVAQSRPLKLMEPCPVESKIDASYLVPVPAKMNSSFQEGVCKVYAFLFCIGDDGSKLCRLSRLPSQKRDGRQLTTIGDRWRVAASLRATRTGEDLPL
jgi:hypothetical protein